MSSEIELDPQQVAERMLEGDWQLVDVRENYEREAGYIPGSRHIEFPELTAQAESIDRNRPVVFVCRVGNRSGVAAQAFRGAGYDAYNLRGGLEAWVASGLEIEPENGYVAPH